jgi:hypothetical protein
MNSARYVRSAVQAAGFARAISLYQTLSASNLKQGQRVASPAHLNSLV